MCGLLTCDLRLHRLAGASYAQYGIENLAIPRAAADIATESSLYLLDIGMWMFLQQFSSRHKHARNAIAALYSGVIDKSLL